MHRARCVPVSYPVDDPAKMLDTVTRLLEYDLDHDLKGASITAFDMTLDLNADSESGLPHNPNSALLRFEYETTDD